VSSPLDELRKVVATCTSCSLHDGRCMTVFGSGPPDAPLMLVGEAPGADEDRSGLPFVGRAGRLLSQLLEAARVPEDRIYKCNIIKCQPPKNKFPAGGKEPEICRGYLLKQIEEIKPKAIILTGKQALRYLLLHGTTEQWEPLIPWINKQYRRRQDYGDTRFLIVYHPSYLMRSNNEEDQEAWVQAVAQLWAYVEHKLAGTAPAPTVFKEIRVPPTPPRMGRNLFARGHRGKVL
jgi:uracil-DNA glycosylase family 4